MPRTIRECATVKWKNKQIKLKYYKESILFNNKIFKINNTINRKHLVLYSTKI